MQYTDNPVLDAMARDYEEDKWLESRPVCCECGEHIQDDYLYDIDGKLYCRKCMESEFEKFTEDYMKGEDEGW